MYTKPEDIEKRSFEIIGRELAELRAGGVKPPLEDYIIKRVIHTTADFDFDDNLLFTRSAAKSAFDLLRSGIDVVTDTKWL
jgi:precorrin-8X/cobalt-precorrin-8 methylmutase